MSDRLIPEKLHTNIGLNFLDWALRKDSPELRGILLAFDLIIDLLFLLTEILFDDHSLQDGVGILVLSVVRELVAQNNNSLGLLQSTSI